MKKLKFMFKINKKTSTMSSYTYGAANKKKFADAVASKMENIFGL